MQNPANDAGRLHDPALGLGSHRVSVGDTRHGRGDHLGGDGGLGGGAGNDRVGEQGKRLRGDKIGVESNGQSVALPGVDLGDVADAIRQVGERETGCRDRDTALIYVPAVVSIAPRAARYRSPGRGGN
jgi:hypothetical protein